MRLSHSSLLTLLIAVFCSLPMCAGQSVLWDQQPDTSLTTVVDTEFNSNSGAAFSTYLVNDVTFSTEVRIQNVTTYFSNNSGDWPTTVSQARFTFFPDDFTPFDPFIVGELVDVTVTEYSPNVLAIRSEDLALVKVPAGVYWIGLTPVIDPDTTSQEFRYDTGSTVGGETFGRNPGGGFGLGTDWFPATTLAVGFSDASITLESGSLLPPFFPPTNGTSIRGFEVSGSFESLCFSNDEPWVFNPGFVLNSNEAPVWVEIEGPSDFLTPGSSEENGIVVESQADTPGLTLTVEEFNFSTNSYEVIGQVSESVGDDTQRFFLATGYVSPVNGLGRFRLGWRQTGIVVRFPWEVRLDWVIWSRFGLP